MTAPPDVPETTVHAARESLWERVSVVWLVPIGALLIALGIAWQTYSERGPLIEITFENGAGVMAGETELRYRDIHVGTVEFVRFTPGLGSVLVGVRVDKEVAPYIDEDAAFWIVQPEVTTSGVSGLNTVLGGVYIEGSWNGTASGTVTRFKGFDNLPLLRPDQPGTVITLRTATGKGLREGTPILYKGLEVGRVGKPELTTDGQGVEAEAVIFAPQDAFLSDRTRFWDTSGISFSLGAGGAAVNFESVSSLLRGGISFDTMVSGGATLTGGETFAVFTDQDEALASLFEPEDEGAQLTVSAVFSDNLAGLSLGAPVSLRGLDIGEVVDLTGIVDAERFGDDRVRLAVTLAIRLDDLTMGGGDATDPEAVLDFLAMRIGQGLRARLTNASLFTGGLKVEMVDLPDADPATLDRTAQPHPVVPTAPADVQDVAASAEGLLARVRALPIEDVLGSVRQFLESANNLIASEDTQAIPGEVRAIIGDVREVTDGIAEASLPDRLATVADNLATLTQDLNEAGAVAQVTAALEAVTRVAGQAETALDGVPDLVSGVGDLVARAGELGLEPLVEQASEVARAAGNLLRSDTTQALPGKFGETLDTLNATIGDAQGVLAQVQDGDAAQKLTDALDAAGQAAADVSAAVAGVPDLVAQVEAVAAQAADLELQALVGQIESLLAEGKSLLSDDATRALPERLGAALNEVTAALEELRAGGTVANVNAALASARTAAEGVATTAESLPELVGRTNSVLAEAETALAAVGDGGSLNKDTRQALREVARAAEALRSLARTLERKPNAILTGR